MPKDPYDILGVARTASGEEIKKAYRALSKEWHPDRHPSTPRTGSGQAGSGQTKKEAEERYKEINQAYELLSDPKRRQMYDQFGHAGTRAGGGFGFGGVDPREFMGAFGGLEDILETFFGRGFAAQAGFGGGVRGGRGRETEGRDLEVTVHVPFATVVNGEVREIDLKKHIACEACGGSGAAHGSDVVACSECRGTGVRMHARQSFFGVVQQTAVCSACHGVGRMPKHPCRSCSGEGRREHRTSLSVKIPPGIDDGMTLRIAGGGEAGRRGGESGDLYVHVRVQPDQRFQREGSDVRSSLTIGVVDAVLGTEVDLPTVDGSVRLRVPPGTQPDQVIRVKGHGVPVLNTHRRGDHYVVVKVEVPARLSRRERELWEGLRNV